MTKSAPKLALLVASMAAPALAQESGDPDAGMAVFVENCASCHSITAGKHGEGPSLAGVMGRRAGALEDYDYSDALGEAEFDWTPVLLEDYLTVAPRDPGGDQLIHTVDMQFGRLAPGDVADLIAFLEVVEN